MNILLTSVGRRTYMVKYFKDALKHKGKIYAANNVYTHSFIPADGYTITPDIYDDHYIDYLIDYCKIHSIDAIVPLFDIDLPVLSANKAKFKQNHIAIVVSNEEFVNICNDKWETFQFLIKNGFNTPKTYLGIKEVIENINQRVIDYPVVIKPRWGMGSIGIFVADNYEELKVLYNKTKHTIANTYLKFESRFDIERSILIQEKISGSEYGLDIFNDLNGNNLCVVPKQKIAMRAGETDVAQVIIDNPRLLNLGKKIAEITNHIANLDIDFFIKDEQFYVLEMNARFGGQYPFSHLSGVDFPQAIIHMLDQKSVPLDIITPEKNVKGAKDIIPVLVN